MLTSQTLITSNVLHQKEIHSIIRKQPQTTQRTQVQLHVKSSHMINSLCVRHTRGQSKLTETSLSELFGKMYLRTSCMHCFHDYRHKPVTYCEVTKQRSRACEKTHIKFIVLTNFDNQQNRTNSNFIFVILALFRITQHQHN